MIEGIERLLSRPRGAFKLGELEQACPGVSRDMVRHVPRERQEQGAIRCTGRGAGAAWTRADPVEEGNALPLNRGSEGGYDQ